MLIVQIIKLQDFVCCVYNFVTLKRRSVVSYLYLHKQILKGRQNSEPPRADKDSIGLHLTKVKCVVGEFIY